MRMYETMVHIYNGIVILSNASFTALRIGTNLQMTNLTCFSIYPFSRGKNTRMKTQIWCLVGIIPV